LLIFERMKLSFSFLFLLFTGFLFAQDLTVIHFDSRTGSSFRALSVIDNELAWVSGNNGWFGRTDDGGQSWEFDQVNLFEEKDFRGLYAFDRQNAILFNAGSPAYILRTTDGGENWLPVYQNSNTEIFLDGIDFWNDLEGVIYGDPIEGKMTLLRTTDGGFTWEAFPDENRPEMEKGENSFAASGTAIRCFDDNQIIIASGGLVSRLFLSKDRGNSWKTIEAPLQQGEPSQGVFSLAVRNEFLVIVGGDYRKEEMAKDHILYSENNGRKWKKPEIPTGGYREAVEFYNDNTLIACGPTGAEISKNRGKSWVQISDAANMHVIRKARNGNLVLMAGREGKILLLKGLKID
jgi:photosystem II stability/assembly factor-like uncharacterized protein